ncbi:MULTISPECIES: hypothetical protein [unclassified Lysobacter]|uniref:hypothetical protein n=1 Tax=unclassified Lysobacter TaxID=2635362 RepID=UPI001BEB8E96|nr:MULTISPECIES: hypothetical protein [unclassified Lysobacter]MBT2748568.1 hypothetical protein [Lysobacter sp. ISL-42]MBT2751503.1 hypothetical protein [Lysobacter sp. ISL-50]MBT2775697.1 hypothetical protein [Lysobacter sp. ISL-54]MBT2782338.1 hypothetical protein [Lysobacter sp. ISL-52]
MNDQYLIADAELRSLGDYLERILLSSYPIPEDLNEQLSLFACYGLASALAERTDTFRTMRLSADLIERLVDACRKELAPMERTIDQVKGWTGKRPVPSEIGEDEMTLRWLLSTIERYFDGLEPEFSALPVHQLNRVLRHARLMQVWDVADHTYTRTLRNAIHAMENAILAAMCAPRN